MRRIACLAVAALCGAGASGQSPLDCVEPDVLHSLLLQGQGEATTITSQVPPEISALRMPGGFNWIGSAERIMGRVNATTTMSQVTAAWRSSLPPDAARAAAASALATSGWDVRPTPAMNSVFRTASMQFAQPACRDGKPVNISASAMDGATYVLLRIQRGNIGNTICDQPMRPAFNSGTGFDAHLPHLEMPVNPANGLEAGMMMSGGSGSSGTAYNAHAEFMASDSAGNIARQFARQMDDQGWDSDADWSGSSTAGSSWSKRVDAGAPVQATLTVTAVDKQQFVAMLRVIRLQ